MAFSSQRSTRSRARLHPYWLLCLLLTALLPLCAGPQLVAQEPEEAAETEEAATADARTDSEPTAEDNPVALDEIVVSASFSLNRENPAETVALSREQILELPTFGDDLFRAISLVPGTSGNDVSSAFNVRGAPYEEVLVRLDGVELFEPFHLKDFSGVLSVVDPQLVDGVEIYPGAFPAAFGDRGAAVVDLTTRTPNSTQTRTGVSLSSLYFTRGNRFGKDDRGSALTSVRRGWLDVVFNLVGDDEEEQEEGAPEYTDLYAKADWSLDDRTEIGVWGLWADDQLDSSEVEEDGVVEAINSSYGNLWTVARGQRLWNDSTVSSARLFFGRVDRERRASEAEGSSDFVVRDDRNLDLFALASETSWQLAPRHLLDAGFEIRSYTADYDYAILRDFTDPISGVSNRLTSSAFLDEINGESFGVWVSDRWRLSDSVVAELGARWDRQTWLEDDDDQLAPRFNLVWDLGNSGVLRAGWGHAYQSQRPNELAVQDDDFTFYGAERYEHRSLGWERTFGKGLRMRLDAFQRLGTDLRPRYVNLFSPAVLFPEGSPDRIRLDADRSEALGLEVFLQGRPGRRLSWWATYSFSEVEDRVDGEWIPRNIDQTHAFTFDVGYRISDKWNLNAAWIFHSGWPITEVSARLVDGTDGPEIEPVPGPIYGSNVDDYHRLDVRLSRSFQLSRGDLLFYVDIQNLYNRENEQGFEFGEDAFVPQPDGSVLVSPSSETWLGIVPSFGLTWSF